MKNIKKLGYILSLILIFNFIFPIKVYAATKEGKVILIDPGHGGFDGGASSKAGTVEKEVNLAIGLKLKNALESEGYTVHLTRETDEGLYEKGQTIKEKKREDLNKRRSMKKDVSCDVFISIHQNMFPQSKCFGAQLWYASNEKSQLLADSIQNSLKEVIQDGNKRVSKPAGDSYLILRDEYDCAAVLLECGFLSNPDEEQRLLSEEHQNLMVNAISLGLEKYFGE